MADRRKDDDPPSRRDDFDFELEDNTKEDDSLMGRSARAVGVSGGLSKITNSAPISVLAYCLSSISMTVVNKYVVSGSSWDLTFLYLAAQAIICVVAIGVGKQAGLIQNLATLDADRLQRCKTETLCSALPETHTQSR